MGVGQLRSDLAFLEILAAERKQRNLEESRSMSSADSAKVNMEIDKPKDEGNFRRTYEIFFISIVAFYSLFMYRITFLFILSRDSLILVSRLRISELPIFLYWEIIF